VNELSLYGSVSPSPTQEGCLPFYSTRRGLVTSCIPKLPPRVGRRRVVESYQRYFIASPFPCSARPRSSPAGGRVTFPRAGRLSVEVCPLVVSRAPRSAHGSGLSRFALKCRPSHRSPRQLPGDKPENPGAFTRRQLQGVSLTLILTGARADHIRCTLPLRGLGPSTQRQAFVAARSSSRARGRLSRSGGTESPAPVADPLGRAERRLPAGSAGAV
jgi:hypothetical protein